MESKMPHKREKGQVGIGTLIVFIAMVLVAAIAAGVLINTAGFLQSQSEETGQQSSSQVTDRIQVVSTVGDNVANQKVWVINMTAKKAPGANDVDLETITAQFITEGQVVDLVHADSDEATAGQEFETFTIQDDDSSIDDSRVINDPADRAIISLDIGSAGGSASNNISADYDTSSVNALDEGQQATIQLVTQSGGESTVTITVPESLTGKTSVSL